MYVTGVVLGELAFRDEKKLLGRNSLKPMSTSCDEIYVKGSCTIVHVDIVSTSATVALDLSRHVRLP